MQCENTGGCGVSGSHLDYPCEGGGTHLRCLVGPSHIVQNTYKPKIASHWLYGVDGEIRPDLFLVVLSMHPTFRRRVDEKRDFR